MCVQKNLFKTNNMEMRNVLHIFVNKRDFVSNDVYQKKKNYDHSRTF
jgi:hypothetical protein